MLSRDTLRQLLAIINTGVASIEKAYSEADVPLPNLDELYTPNDVEESVASTTMLVVAAASQLISTLRDPGQHLYEQSFAPAMCSAALSTVLKAHIPEFIREAGPKGAHVRDICATTNMNPAKIARLLRLLASRHIFREVEPDVFAHNRLSCMLDTGKPIQDVLASPVSKYHGARGIGSLVDVCISDCVPAAAFIPECMMDPVWSASDQYIHAPFNRAFNHDGSLYEWYTKPGNEAAWPRFNESMAVHAKLNPPRTILNGFPWADLAPDTLVVDVGGGVGSAVLALLREHRHLKYAVQDLPPVIQDARAYWDREAPESIANGQVSLQEQNFFESQPTQNVGVFILRNITHNWSTDRNREILSQFRQAAQPKTRVVIIDHIVPHAGAFTEMHGANIPGARGYEPPVPLLASAGSEIAFAMDILMLDICNALERTLANFVEMVQGTGWNVERIYRGVRPGVPCQIVLAPGTLLFLPACK